MTKKILIDEAVVKQALEALEGRCGTNAEERLAGGAITALREALEVNNKGVNALAEQPAPGRAVYEDGDVFERITARKKQQSAEPVGEYVIVGRAELAMVRNALQRDADEGKQSRKAMLRALDESARPAQSHQPLTEDELRNVLRNTNHMIRNAMHGPFWPELEQACRAIEAALGITGSKT